MFGLIFVSYILNKLYQLYRLNVKSSLSIQKAEVGGSMFLHNVGSTDKLMRQNSEDHNRQRAITFTVLSAVKIKLITYSALN